MSVINSGQTKNIEGLMMGLMKELEKLAPHPNHPKHRGPVFIHIDAHIKPAAEYDGMLGSMMMESVLGMAFSEAVSGTSGSETQNVDWSNMAECVSAYTQDRPSNSNYALGQKNVISGHFNQRPLYQKMMNAFTADLPKRMGLERWLSYYQRKLYALRKHAPAAAFTRAA